MFDDSFMKSPRSRFRAAMVLAIVADAAQMVTEKGANCDFGSFTHQTSGGEPWK
jgi:hypothetical protein